MLPDLDTTLNIVQGAVLVPDKDWNFTWKRGYVQFFTNKEGNTANHLPTTTPGFLAVEDDLSTLEIPGLGTLEDLSWAHSHLTFSHQYSAKAAQKYKELRAFFPVAMTMDSPGELSDALIGKKNWRSTQVMREVKVVLGEQRGAEKYIEAWREQAVKAVVRAFQIQQETERNLYQEKSYYRWVEEHPEEDFVFTETDPSPERTDELYGKYCA